MHTQKSSAILTSNITLQIWVTTLRNKWHYSKIITVYQICRWLPKTTWNEEFTEDVCWAPRKTSKKYRGILNSSGFRAVLPSTATLEDNMDEDVWLDSYIFYSRKIIFLCTVSHQKTQERWSNYSIQHNIRLLRLSKLCWSCWKCLDFYSTIL